MTDWKTYFKGKKITVLGLGLLGRAVGDAEFLAEAGAELTITDLKTETELAPSLERLKKFPHITYRLGGHALEDFHRGDYVLKAAGVPLDSPYIEEARKNGIPIKMSASWFAELAGVQVVGVTGTRGKTTTTMLLYEILKRTGKRVLLGGNVRGVSTLALLKDVSPESVAVFELDSWQLQGFGDAKISPNISVFTTFFDDHLNYYHGDRSKYLEDKAQIFLHQKAGDTFILGTQANDVVLGSYMPPVAPTVADASFVHGWDTNLLGEHNRANIACAVLAAQAVGVSEAVCKEGVAEFKGVSGRLELVREVTGIKVYNDTTATTPEATIAALRALSGKSIVLIMGGSEKGLDMSALVPEVKKVKKVILLTGSGTDALKNQLPEASLHGSLKNAVEEAFASSTTGDVVLFSPAFTSFGMFKNEYDRGDQFVELVNEQQET